jgi:acyl-CoA synthetase (AMP-forming)/AMP-acid ligase II
VWLITPEESERDQRQVAGALGDHGLGRGDRLVLCLPNSPQLLATIIGAMRIGVVPVLLNASLLPAELDALVADADPALVIRTPDGLQELFRTPSAGELADVPLCRPMHYTSGTSGRPKGVWSDVLSDQDAVAMHTEEARVWALEADDTHLTCSPLYHSVAVRFSTQALLRGASVVLLPRFDAAEVATALRQHEVRSAFMVPTHLQRLLSQPVDVSGIRLLAHAGAPCPRPLKYRLLESFPPGSVWEFYGSTEGQYTVCPPDEWLQHPGTVGRARPGRHIEIDADQRVWCSVPRFARWSYWHDSAKTVEAWRGDAFTVGDVGHLDTDGYLFLDGRRDDLIITGGVNVYPAEVEQALADLPGVEEIIVFGVDDAEWGQRVCAAVTGHPDTDAILQHARTVLAGYKCPRKIYAVDDLPRTATGKVRRSEIATWLGIASAE